MCAVIHRDVYIKYGKKTYNFLNSNVVGFRRVHYTHTNYFKTPCLRQRLLLHQNLETSSIGERRQ